MNFCSSTCASYPCSLPKKKYFLVVCIVRPDITSSSFLPKIDKVKSNNFRFARKKISFSNLLTRNSLRRVGEENQCNDTVFENHKKVLFNIASEASYVYILSQVNFKRIKNWWKRQNSRNSNATFWVIFKQCEDE